jgi:hypothetical protein
MPQAYPRLCERLKLLSRVVVFQVRQPRLRHSPFAKLGHQGLEPHRQRLADNILRRHAFDLTRFRSAYNFSHAAGLSQRVFLSLERFLLFDEFRINREYFGLEIKVGIQLRLYLLAALQD